MGKEGGNVYRRSSAEQTRYCGGLELIHPCYTLLHSAKYSPTGSQCHKSHFYTQICYSLFRLSIFKSYYCSDFPKLVHIWVGAIVAPSWIGQARQREERRPPTRVSRGGSAKSPIHFLFALHRPQKLKCNTESMSFIRFACPAPQKLIKATAQGQIPQVAL